MKRMASLFLIVTFLGAQAGVDFKAIKEEPDDASSDELTVTQTQDEESDQDYDEVVSLSTDEVYRVEPGDIIEIDILGEEELSRALVVWHNGNISFPLIGEIKVSGLSTDEIADLIVRKLKKYFRHPVVSVILKSPTLAYVSVYGEVLKPGVVEYQRGFRVTDYIALAGGPNPNANLGKVKVVRFRTEKPEVTTLNVNEILEKGLTKENFELKSGDWLYISKKFTIDWRAVLQFSTLILTAVNLYITIDRLNE